MLWSLGSNSPSLEVFDETGRFVINVLALDQVELSKQFSKPLSDKFSGVECIEGLGGVPVIPHCVATFECKTIQRTLVGDHVLFFGTSGKLRLRKQDAIAVLPRSIRASGRSRTKQLIHFEISGVAMKYSTFMMPLHPPGRNIGETIAEDREAIILADRLGFSEAYVGEHVTDAAETVTSSMIFLASLISETKTSCWALAPSTCQTLTQPLSLPKRPCWTTCCKVDSSWVSALAD